jgi:hypothetical protein
VREAGGRAQRFGFHLPVRYRPAGGTWHDGQIENVSCSGVLFHAAEAVPDLDTEVEIVFVLPVRPAAPRIVCRCRVVRRVPSNGNGAAGVAATIVTYRFVRGRPAPA